MKKVCGWLENFFSYGQQYPHHLVVIFLLSLKEKNMNKKIYDDFLTTGYPRSSFFTF